MLFKNKFFLIGLVLAMLLRSTAGLAMQIDMAYLAMNNPVKMQVAKVLPACHTAMQTASLAVNLEVNMGENVGSRGIGADAPSNLNPEPSACALCCIAATMPSETVFAIFPTQHLAPTAVLFNNLPAPAQRPAKPPLV